MSRAPVTVLVTGAGSACGVNIIHSLRHAGGYRIVATDIFSASAGLVLADKGYVIPKEGSDGKYLDAILDIAKRESVQALIPGFDAELPYLSAAGGTLRAQGVVPVIGEPDFIRIANDKLATQQFLAANGFPFLRSYGAAEQAQAVAELGFPLVVKPRSVWGSRGVQVVGSEAALRQAVDHIVSLGWEPLLQEFIPETEGEFTNSVAVATDHDMLGVVCMRRELEKGDSRRIFLDDFPDLKRQCEAIARALNTSGPINIQCRLLKGRAYVFEFNARFSTTNIVRTAAGYNEVDALVKNFLTGEKVLFKGCPPVVAIMYLDYVYVKADAYQALKEAGVTGRAGHVRNRLG
ncbi:MAG: ATP-grasp domain-containing protein [Nitrospirae bacterium]|nr:MAG: ATP-grasp domain-containing protein [Nitrospirota bacterium]